MTNIPYPPIIYQIYWYCDKLLERTHPTINNFSILIHKLQIKGVSYYDENSLEYLVTNKYELNHQYINALKLYVKYRRGSIFIPKGFFDQRLALDITPFEFLTYISLNGAYSCGIVTTNVNIVNKILKQLPILLNRRQDIPSLLNPTIIHTWNKMVEHVMKDISQIHDNLYGQFNTMRTL